MVSLLEIEGIAENRHSGIPAIREEAKQYGYKPVEFQDRQASFTVRFYSVPERAGAAEANVPWSGTAVSDPAKKSIGIRDRILDFCKEPQSLESVAHALGLGKYYVRRRYIEPLLVENALSMTLPDRPRSKYQRYVANDSFSEVSSGKQP
ncbi:Fic family protein [Bifidobacterium asteroides]|uniref:Fic family protein n=1 Tax=Bifidobacterium asteroides TaxID=1684 RepID=UPI001E60A475|nr:ATP-binding protein [Bifidobacterium asteroides]